MLQVSSIPDAVFVVYSKKDANLTGISVLPVYSEAYLPDKLVISSYYKFSSYR